MKIIVGGEEIPITPKFKVKSNTRKRCECCDRMIRETGQKGAWNSVLCHRDNGGCGVVYPVFQERK